MLQSDDLISQLSANVGNIFNSNKYKDEIQEISGELKKLTNMHQHLQQKMYNTTLENKKLKLELKKIEDKKHD
jgi:hypothetical protein